MTTIKDVARLAGSVSASTVSLTFADPGRLVHKQPNASGKRLML